MRFIRDYKLMITLTNSDIIEIIPELRVQFEIVKSIRGGLNSAKIKIYNLSENNRKRLVKDKTDAFVKMPFLFQAGYSKIETIFKGTVFEAYSEKNGSDYITTISSLDGGYDLHNSFTSKTIVGNYKEQIINDLEVIKKGKLTEEKKLIRAKVLIGNSLKLIEENLSSDEAYFIDNETIHIIKDDEVLSDNIVLVDASTGLLNTPIKKDKETTFRTLLNPTLKIGHLVQLESSSKNLNGIYKTISIKYSGDNYGSDWTQEVLCMLTKKVKVL